jgi:hypothetical protein
MAEENRDWGYRRIHGALSNLRHELARSTIADILKRHGFASMRWRIVVPASSAMVDELLLSRGYGVQINGDRHIGRSQKLWR